MTESAVCRLQPKSDVFSMCFNRCKFSAIVVCIGEKKDDIQFTNDVLSMLSPEGEKVALTKVGHTIVPVGGVGVRGTTGSHSPLRGIADHA